MTSVSATSTSTSTSVSVAISPDPTPGPQTKRSTFPSAAIASAPPLQSPHKVTTRSNGDHRSKKVPKDPLESGEYKHAFAVHSIPRTSTLSHDSVDTPSFIGFRNLMVLVLSRPFPRSFVCVCSSLRVQLGLRVNAMCD